jgi:hypothetical protein
LGVGVTWNDKFGAQDKKKQAEDGEDESKPKKKKRDDDKPVDMTAGLTGQNPKSLKRQNNQTAGKAAKKAKPSESEIKLPKSDMNEVATISKAIQDSLASSKKTMALLESKKKKKVQEQKD